MNSLSGALTSFPTESGYTMQLIATPTLPLEIPIGSMLDIPELPGEYAVLKLSSSVGPNRDQAALMLSHAGDLHSLLVQIDQPVDVVSYAVSNMLETGK